MDIKTSAKDYKKIKPNMARALATSVRGLTLKKQRTKTDQKDQWDNEEFDKEMERLHQELDNNIAKICKDEASLNSMKKPTTIVTRQDLLERIETAEKKIDNNETNLGDYGIKQLPWIIEGIQPIIRQTDATFENTLERHLPTNLPLFESKV
jgi:hypothetical protein